MRNADYLCFQKEININIISGLGIDVDIKLKYVFSFLKDYC